MISKKHNEDDMGGFGSGRKLGASCTGDYRSIDVRQWQREKLLVVGLSFNATWLYAGKDIGTISVKAENKQVRLSYSCQRNGAEWERLDYSIQLEATSCHYGGGRYWFTCPAVGCGKRVAKLYLGDKYFACRQCYRLTYPCQRESPTDRILRKAEKLKVKLQWQSGLYERKGEKPKGMHWKTFMRLQAKYDEMIIIGLNDKLAALKKRVRHLGWLDK